jgi:hypothetical protein
LEVRTFEIKGPMAEWLEGLVRGERDMPASHGHRHHFVPQFMLRRFRSSDRKLFALDKESGECDSVVPKDAAWQTDLYDVETIDEQHAGFMESFFSLIENYAAESVKVVLSPGRDLPDGDRGNIAFLIAAQELRAPGALADLREWLTQAATMHSIVELSQRGGNRRERRLAAEAAEALQRGEVTIAPSQEMLVEALLRGIANTVGPIYHLPWTVFEAKTSEAFICSDRPLTMHDPTPQHAFSRPGWLSSETVQVTMPLSSRCCLQISPAGSADFARRPSERRMAIVNRRTYAWASRFVYGPDQAQLLDLHAFAQAHPDQMPRRTPQRLVMLEDPQTADPAVARGHREAGERAYVEVVDDDGTRRGMSYEVINSVEDARASVAARRVDGEMRRPDALTQRSPTRIR